jgi:hypothetical protein
MMPICLLPEQSPPAFAFYGRQVGQHEARPASQPGRQASKQACSSGFRRKNMQADMQRHENRAGGPAKDPGNLAPGCKAARPPSRRRQRGSAGSRKRQASRPVARASRKPITSRIPAIVRKCPQGGIHPAPQERRIRSTGWHQLAQKCIKWQSIHLSMVCMHHSEQRSGT